MKKDKKSCPCSCLCNPVTPLSFLRLVVGVMFLMAGIGKVSDIASFQGMLGGMGYEGVLLTIVSWLVAVLELLGGVALLAGKFFPCCKLRKLFIMLLLPVMVGIIYHTNVAGFLTGKGDIMGLLQNLVLTFSIWFLATTKATCPFGIGGCKCVEACTGGNCDMKKK